MGGQSGNPNVTFLVEAGGGVLRHITDMYIGLTARGIRTRLIISPNRIDDRYRKQLAAMNSADVFVVEMAREPHFSDLKVLSTVRSILRSAEPTILHAHSTKAGLLGFALRKNVAKAVFSPHAYRGTDPELNGVSRTIVERVEATYSKRYDKVVAEVPLEYQYAKGIGIPESQLEVIPNGLSLQSIDFSELRKKRQDLQAPVVLGLVARFAYQKNPELFIETLHKLDHRGYSFKAIIVGAGPLEVALHELAAKYGILAKIEWWGEQPASTAYPEMDIMLHTSRYEALPYVLLESCAWLLPTVCTSNPGSEAVFRDVLPENIIREATSDALADQVGRLIDDNQKRRTQMNVLEERAHYFSTDTMINRFEALYRGLWSEY